MSSAQQQKTSSGLITMIHKSRQTVLELLKAQQYDTSEYENFGVNEVHAMYTNKDVPKQLDMILSTKQVLSKKKTVYVKYHLGKTLRVENIQDYVDDLFNIEQILNKKTDTLIIILKQDMNQTLMNILNEFWDRHGIFIILFSLERLQFNILEHQYVPKHVILTEDERTEMFKRYNILDVKNLPDISRFDPVAQAIGMRPGEICRIERPSKTSVISNYYRYCTQTML
jgi:DNA-directed RNA polymerase I, II, and III subunit RPABC1